MRHRFVLVAASAVALAWSTAAAEEPPFEGGPVVIAPAERAAGPVLPILDDSGYWRYHFTYAPPMIDPARMQAKGEALLGEKEFARTQGAIERRLQRQGLKDADWTRHVSAGLGPWSFDGRADAVMAHFKTEPPPADWMEPSFDDTDWLRQNIPYLVGDFFRYVSAQQVRQIRLRARFEIADPSSAGELTLSAVYRGGIRVFLNGREIGRGHLPAGAVTNDTLPDPYPDEAYMLLAGEYPPEDYQGTGYYAQYWQLYDKRLVLVPEMPGYGQFKPRPGNLPKIGNPEEYRYHGNFGITRAAYDRLTRLRDRRLTVKIPPSEVRKGVNLLTVEVRSSAFGPLSKAWYEPYRRNAAWYHAALPELKLAAAGHAPTVLKRPPGVQVWVEDIHRRTYAADYLVPEGRARPARIVAARNGTCGVQVVVGTDRELTGLNVAVGPIASTGGKPLRASAKVLYGVPHTMDEMKVGDKGRRAGNWPGFDFPQVFKARYGNTDVPYFDHLSDSPPASVPADSAWPAWVSVKVPADATPGTYRGEITVSAEGMDAQTVPLEVAVHDWAVPDPADFTFVAALEQSPYAVASQYEVAPWSEEHFKLLERTFALLGRAGNDWLNIPVLIDTEFGNRHDSPIRWTMKKDGALSADFTIVDRYIDLAGRHCGRPKVINFIVMHPSRPGAEASDPMDIPVVGEASGQPALLAVDRRDGDQARRDRWRQIATIIRAHMTSRGLAGSHYWGYTWDGPGGDPSLVDLLNEFAPGVYWTKGCHAWGVVPHIKAYATVYNSALAVGLTSRRGWSQEDLWLAYPRYWGTVIDCSDYSTPFSNRLMCDRAIVAGARGVGRVGADYWGKTYLDGMKGSHYPVGVPNLMLLYPGRDGADTSMRYEVLCEGIQEAEARIFIEQSLAKLDPERHADLIERVTGVLDRHNLETLLDPPVASRYQLAEACARGWQGRSERLYAAAEEMAGLVGVDLDRVAVKTGLPARGKATLTLKLRNWTGRPREWTASADQPWIQPAATKGQARPGSHDFAVVLDAADLEPGKPAEGKLVLTDPETGRNESVTVAANVGEVFSVRSTRRVCNVAPGRAGELAMTVFNHSGSELAFKAAGSESWLKVEPAAGKLPPGGQAELTVRLSPPDRADAAREAVLTVTESKGVRREVPLTVHVVPAYKPPAGRPGGTAAALEKLPAQSFTRYTDSRRRKSPAFFAPHRDRPEEKLSLGPKEKTFDGGLVGPLGHELAINLEGGGYKGFAAEVGVNARYANPQQLAWCHAVRAHFEIVADGIVVAQSGLVGPTDEPRLLVVEGLDGVKELILRVRAGDDGEVGQADFACWADAAFYK